MPIVKIHVPKGYSPEEKQRLEDSLGRAVRFVLPVTQGSVTVRIHEATGHEDRPDVAPARQAPEAIIREFLDAMANRDLVGAQEFLATDFEMNFPCTPTMHALQELIDWAVPRYRFVTKTYEGFDSLQGSGDAAIVYCRGTLSGEWTDGSPFDGIRFVDRFEIVDDRIIRQDVWNDIAETRAQV